MKHQQDEILTFNGTEYNWTVIESALQTLAMSQLHFRGMIYTDDIIKFLLTLYQNKNKH